MELEKEQIEGSKWLTTFKTVVLTKYPQLVLRTECDTEGNHFVRVEHQVAQLSAVKYVSEFLVVAETGKSDQVIELKLLTFAGKTLKTEELDLVIPEFSSNVLSDWSGNKIRLCQGVEENKVSDNVIEEHFGNKLVKRARTCHYETTSQENQCEACMQVDSDYNNEPPESLKTEVQIKGEPEDYDDQSWTLWDCEDFPEPEVYLDRDDCDEKYPRKIKPKGRSSNSPSDSSEEESDEYVPPNQKSKGKRGRPRKEPKLEDGVEKKKRGRPRKNLWLYSEGGEGIKLEKEKKKRGRPRKNLWLYGEDGNRIQKERGRRGRPITNDWLYSDEEEDHPVKSEKKPAQFPCSNCKEVFISRFLAKNHGSFCSQSLPVPDALAKNCPICLKHFMVQKKMETHLEFHEDRLQLNKAVNCPRCDVTLESKYELNPHYQETHGKNMGCCIECLKEMEVFELEKHVRDHFIRLKNHLCTICGASYSSRSALKGHILLAHEDHSKNMEICDECGKLVHKVRMAKHKNSIHPRARLYVCTVCGKEFRTYTGYAKHVTIHSFNKPWACDTCDYRSVRKDNVRHHVRKCHPMFEEPKDHVIKIGTFEYDSETNEAKKAKLHIVKLTKQKPVPPEEPKMSKEETV